MSKYNLFLFPDWEGHGGLTLWEGLRHIICPGRTGNENTGLVKSELQCFVKIGHWRPRSPPAESGPAATGQLVTSLAASGKFGFFEQF